MKSELGNYYLRENVYFEPLFNSWYVWPHIISPAQSARHTTNTHLRLMRSFVSNYQLHIMACKEPGLAGGEFLDCSEAQVNEIKNLISSIEEKCGDLFELSDAIDQLDALIREHTSGLTLEGLYSKIPDPLKGYVELFFDLEHTASYRIIEGLIYKSRYYKPEFQSVSFGILTNNKERPFVLSTPRLPDENHLHLKLDFNSPILSKIMKSRDVPLSLQEIHELFEKIDSEGGLPYLDLFTQDSPKIAYQKPAGLRVKYTGHAGFLIENSSTAILIDPVIATRDSATSSQMLSFSELPPVIDYICITHTHQDHANIETLLQLRHKTNTVVVPKNNGGTLADPSLRLLLKQLNFHVIEVDDMDEILFDGGKITSIPFLGEHGDLNVRSKTAWFIEIEGKKLFMGADSSNLDPNMYKHIHRIIGDVDLLAIGMECVGAPYTWLYGALHTKRIPKNIKDSRRLNGADSKQALAMVNIFKPKVVNVYALGLEPCYKYFMGLDYDDESKQIIESNLLIDACRKLRVPAEALNGSKEIILNPDLNFSKTQTEEYVSLDEGPI